MNAASRGVWGWASALALLVSMGFSWRLLPLRSLPGSGWEGQERSGLLSAVSRRPEFAFGFRNLLADIAWLQAVQVAGNLKMTPTEYDRLYALLNVEADLDPKFEMPYLLGGLVLGESTRHARKALRVLGRGREQYPADWRFPFYMGYTSYFSLGETETAGKAMAEAAQLPGSPAYLPGLASRMLSEAKDPGKALAMLPGIPAEPNGGRYRMEPGGKVRSDRVTERLRVFQKK
jgi:hypothetical protein